MRIEVNNGGSVEIVRTGHGIAVHHRNSDGTLYDIDTYDDGEIIMALNLLRYMRDNDIKSALVPFGHESEMRRYLSNLLNNGDLQDFRIFQ